MRFATGFLLAIVLGSLLVAYGDIQQQIGNEVVEARDLASRIYGGTRVTDPQKYPFYVLLLINIPGQGWGQCGGALIAPDIVLTAAHCACGNVNMGENGIGVENCDDPTVRVYYGEAAVNRDSNGSYKTCTEWVYDPQYYQNNVRWWSDFALCKLSEPIETDESIASLVLNKDAVVPTEGDMLTIIGFGLTEDGGLSQYLREVDIPFMPSEECRAQPNDFQWIDDRQLCAGYSFGEVVLPDREYPSTGQGDSGGPILLPKVVGDRTIYTHVGVASYIDTQKYAQDGIGSVYAKTSSRIPWIYEAVCDTNGLGTDSDFCQEFSPSCNSPELIIEFTSTPENNSWKLFVEEGNGFVEFTSFETLFSGEHSYDHRLCLEYGKNYKFEAISPACNDFDPAPTVDCYLESQFTSCPSNTFPMDNGFGVSCPFGSFGCAEFTSCSPEAVESPCDCGNYESCGLYTLTLDGTILENSVDPSCDYSGEAIEFEVSTIFSTGAPVASNVPTGAPNDAPGTEAPTNAVIPFVNRDENGNPICEDLPVNVRFNVIFGEDDRDTGDEDDPEDKKRKNCASMEGFNIRQSETWCNRDARIRGIPQEYEEVLPNGSYVKVYNLCPESCRACADTCADSNQVFTVEGADPPVNRRCPYLDKRTDATAGRLCRNKIAKLKRGRVTERPLKEQCARTCGLLGEGKCAAFLSNSIGV